MRLASRSPARRVARRTDVLGRSRRTRGARHGRGLQLEDLQKLIVDWTRQSRAPRVHCRAEVKEFSVGLSPATYDAVRAAATRAHLTPSALIRQWVTERVEETNSTDLATAVATLRHDVERVADLVRPS